jgi:hypothetical protein
VVGTALLRDRSTEHDEASVAAKAPDKRAGDLFGKVLRDLERENEIKTTPKV